MNRTLVFGTLAGALALGGCTTPGKRTAIGTGAGAAAGAGAGAIIGHQVGDQGKGAMIGAAVGAVLGGSIGNRLDKQAKELAQIAETKRTEEGILTKLKNDLLFDTGSADLKSAAQQNITQIANIIKQYPEDHVTVVGYTDSVGSDSYNQQLSERRARAVKLALVSNGVPATAVEAMGQGESNPVSPNDTEAGRSKNRRVELNISVDPSKVKS
jgi:outer membrane protein OmpA-like peptidoglycan-associated protein